MSSVSVFTGVGDNLSAEVKTEVISVLPDQSIQVRMHAIARNKNDIARSAFRSKVVAYGLRAAIIGTLTYGAWGFASAGFKWVKSWLEEKKSNALPPLEEKKAYTIEEIQAFFPDISKRLNVLWAALLQKEKVSGKKADVKQESPQQSEQSDSFIKSLGMQSISMLGFTAVSTVCQPYLEQLFFHDDIDWFLNKKTHLEQALEQLQIHAAAFDSRKSLPGYKVEYSVQALQDQLVDVVAQIELMLGFMEYLLEQATKQGKIIPSDLQDAPALIIRITNDFCMLLHEKLQLYARGGEPASLTSDVLCFVTDIKNNSAAYKYFELRLEQAYELVTA